MVQLPLEILRHRIVTSYPWLIVGKVKALLKPFQKVFCRSVFCKATVAPAVGLAGVGAYAAPAAGTYEVKRHRLFIEYKT